MSRKLSHAAIAVASDGTLFISAAHIDGSTGITAVLRRAVRESGTVFVGVAVAQADARQILTRLDNAGAEAVAVLVGRRQRRRRTTARSRRSTAS